jgi:hypothetical protein
MTKPSQLSPLPIFISLAVAALLGSVGPLAQAQSNKQQKEEISAKTSWGSFDAAVSTSPGKLDLPLYPGAKLLKEDADKNTGSLSFHLSISGKPDVHFMVGKFQTPDSLEKVRDFYQKKLGSAVTKYTEKTEDGGSEFEIKHKMSGRFVKLKRVQWGTQIDLVRVEGLDVDDN